MNSRRLRSFVGAAVLALSPAVAIAQGGATPSVAAMSPDAQEAAKVVDAFHAALAQGDGAAAAAFLTADALIYEGGHVERSRAEYASHHAGSDAAYAAAVPSRLQRRSGTANETTAWITGESRATGAFKGKDVDRLTTETMILRKTDDGWRIAHIHWSSRAAP